MPVFFFLGRTRKVDRIALWAAANSLKARPKVNEWMSPVIIRPVARRLTERGINERPSSPVGGEGLYTLLPGHQRKGWEVAGSDTDRALS